MSEAIPTEINWDDVWKVERDICFLYHVLHEHAAIDGDQPYGTLYKLPYWRYLRLEQHGFPEDVAAFVREGSLVAIFAMAVDVIDGSGTYLLPLLGDCRAAVEELKLAAPQASALADAVLAALVLVERGERADDAMVSTSEWVNRTFVGGYFREMARHSEQRPGNVSTRPN